MTMAAQDTAQIAINGQKPYASNAEYRPLLTSQRKAASTRLQMMTRTAGPREALAVNIGAGTGYNQGIKGIVVGAGTWSQVWRTARSIGTR